MDHEISDVGFQVYEAADRYFVLRRVDILRVRHASHPLFKSAFTELMVYARDLMKKCEIVRKMKDLPDPSPSAPHRIEIAETIRHIRDCVCHIDSDKRTIGSGSNSYTLHIDATDVRISYGKHSLGMKADVFPAIDAALAELACVPEIRSWIETAQQGAAQPRGGRAEILLELDPPLIRAGSAKPPTDRPAKE